MEPGREQGQPVGRPQAACLLLIFKMAMGSLVNKWLWSGLQNTVVSKPW